MRGLAYDQSHFRKEKPTLKIPNDTLHLTAFDYRQKIPQKKTTLEQEFLLTMMPLRLGSLV